MSTEPSAASAATQDYAKAIYAIAERTHAPVSTTDLAERLKTSTPAASAMLKRLSAAGLVDHTPYRGVELTPAGEQIALETIRHHRLIELFLHEAVGMPWDQVHDEAEVLEHAISERLEQAIASKLGNPKFDPHGDPIPTVDGEVFEREHVSLASMQAGSRGTFVRVSDSNPEMLRYLSDKHVAPGDELQVKAREPFGGPIQIGLESAGGDISISESIALIMRIAPQDTETGDQK